jgi:hypothetical protein
MRDTVRIERLFSLFTSSDRAEAIAGDLIEQRPERGPTWFWWHVLATAVALWRAAASRSPLRTLGLAATGCVLLAVPVFAGVAAVGLFPALLSGLAIWSLLSFFWWGGALWAGASIVALAPTRGMAACVTLAALAEALLLALSLAGVRLDAGSDTSGIFYLTAAAAAVPLLIGGAVVHERSITCSNETERRS